MSIINYKSIPSLDEFDKKGGFNHAIRVLDGSIVYPDRSDHEVAQFGVVDQAGEFEELSRVAITREQYSTSPVGRGTGAVDEASGTYIYAGHLRGHFGHFIVEGLARLWAMDHLNTKLDGIVYFPYGGRPELSWKNVQGRKDQVHRIFSELGIDTPLKMVTRDTRFERLIIPEIGFGHHEKFYGSSAFRAYFGKRLLRRVEELPKSDKKFIYISRSNLGPRKGTIAGEDKFEKILESYGYFIFHPQDFELSDQIRIIGNAERILGVEGSALHFAAMVCSPSCKVGMIMRRPASMKVSDSYVMQFQSFKNISLKVFDPLIYIWVGRSAKIPRYDSLAVPDYERLFEELWGAGFVDKKVSASELPTEDDFYSEVQFRSERQGIILRRYYIQPPEGVQAG